MSTTDRTGPAGPRNDVPATADTLVHDALRPPSPAAIEHEQRGRAIEAALFGGAPESVTVGRFRLADRIGEGGMGAIFAGVDEATGAPVAIKVMHGLGHDARRFEREIAVLADLRHPRIVGYIDHGVAPDGRLYLAMERLQGEDLRSYLAHRRPTVHECITLAIHVAEGLAVAHERGCIHRDIKPSNLFLVDGAIDRVKILDFGIARASGVMPGVTHTGMILGTLGYMAPEQASGDPRLDHRADLFALGCVLYEALAGEPPFPGDHAVAILAKILLDQPKPLRSVRPEIPARLEALVERALGKRPDDRPPSAAAMIDELLAAAREAPIDAPTRPVRVAVVSYREQQAICILLVAGEERPIDPHAVTFRAEVDGPTRRAAAAHGASVTPLLDGSELLVFALDGSIADAVAAAAHCALAIRAARPEVRQALALGRGEQRGDSIVGAVIDRVSRLAAEDEPGAIVVDDASARALGPAFATERSGAHVRLIGARDEPALPLLLGRPSAFVGRARELGRLSGLYDHAIEVGRGCAARIVARPGLGKSRLAREFLRGLTASGHDPLLLVLRCSATLEGSPLGALSLALRGLAGITRDDDPAQAHAKVRRRFGAAGPHQVAFLAELCGVALDDALGELLDLARRTPAATADAQRLAWLDWLQAEARSRPLVIVVEDLQWCDDRTADFVRAAAEDLAERPLMLIVTARPEADARFPATWPSAGVEPLELGPLSARAGEALVRQALGPVDAEVAHALITRAGGNPFFLEELVRAHGAGDAAALPDSVLMVVQARLRRVDDEARRLLRAASVFDGAFDPAAVACLLGEPAIEVQRRIDALVTQELLAPEGVEGSRHVFTHAIVRDAAYATLSDADRAPAHRAAAAWLEGAGGSEPAAIAAHYDRGDDRVNAGVWYVRAARRAIACVDLVAAGSHAARALERGVVGAALAEVHVVEAEVALWSGDIITADRHASAALALVEPGTEIWFTAIRRRLTHAMSAMAMDEVRALCEQLRPFREVSSSERLLCLTEASFALCVSGAVAEAQALYAEVDRLTADTTTPLVRGALHRVRAAIAGHQQHLWASLKELEASIAPFEEAGDLRSACRIRGTLAWMLLTMGATDRAEALVREGLRLAQRVGAEHSRYYLRGAMTAVRFKQGRLDEALAEIVEVLPWARERGERRIYGYTLLFRVGIDDDAGATDDEALARAREGVDQLRPFASTHLLACALLARALLRRGALDEASALARDGLARLRAFTSALDDEFFVWSRFIDLLAQVGADDEADRATVDALDRVARLHAQIDEPALARGLLDYEPVRVIVTRAEARGIVIDGRLP